MLLQHGDVVHFGQLIYRFEFKGRSSAFGAEDRPENS